MSGAQALLKHLVGRVGAEALQNAPAVPGLHAFVLPRAAYVWVEGQSDAWAAINGYGEIGFKKTETGYRGFIKTAGIEHNFVGLSAEKVAATMVVLAGQKETATPPDAFLIKISKVIQNLVKGETQKVSSQKEYTVSQTASGNYIHLAVRLGSKLCGEVDVDVGGDVPVVKRWEVEHDPEAEGALFQALQSIKPMSKAGPDAPSLPQKPAMTGAPLGFMDRDSMMVVKKSAEIRVKIDRAARKCSCCGAANWGEGRFVGCYCFRDLAPMTKSYQVEDEVVLAVESWPERDVLSFLERLA